MKPIKVAGAALNQTPLAWERNKTNILEAIEQARKDGVSILCLPELCITGYGCEDAFHSPGLLEMAWKILKEILPHTQGMLVSLGLPIQHQNGVFNTACLVSDKKILGFVAKRFLAGDGIHYEPRWFKPWPVGVRGDLKVANETYPIGDIYFDVSGVKIGFEICEDAWVARRPGGDLSLQSIDIILNPSASHFAFGKFEVRKRFVLEGSRAFGVSYIYSNLLGCEAGRVIFDGGTLIASEGQLFAAGKRFSFQDCLMTSSFIDVERVRMNQARTTSFQPALQANLGYCIFSEFLFHQSESVMNHPRASFEEWEKSSAIKNEEFVRAVTLGLYDYFRKTKSNGFIVSLSGGADSTAVAVLVAIMVEFAVAELGLQGFLKKAAHVQSIQDATQIKQIIQKLLTCVYQSTENSGNVTRKAASEVAAFLDAEYFEFDVDAIVKSYVDIVSRAIHREMNWETDDIALQNIQARVRAPGIWLLANERKALLLTTSNRSEAAVGYATMDGDTCGGLCPIGGIDKAFLREWLYWMETEGPKGLHSLKILSLVNQQAPTAELRPQESGQTDEVDLMPYPILDAIERAAIRDKRTPIEVFQIIKENCEKQYSIQNLAVWTERFFVLWCRNQWKRERYAPSFHLDDENLDPKTWCRFPILSGGYERELEELRAYINALPALQKKL